MFLPLQYSTYTYGTNNFVNEHAMHYSHTDIKYINLMISDHWDFRLFQNRIKQQEIYCYRSIRV